ncbi:rho guanine nucleotide exchange factor 17-like protein, partial [Dinothrombium tinctorium]
MSREQKSKLTLDAILIMPVQRIPRYELLIKELLKHTPTEHPDHEFLLKAQKEVHELALKINRMEKEAFLHEQMQQRVKEIEHLIEGVMDLSHPDRTFIRYDFVSIPGGLGTKKERCLFLFSDILLITSIKKKSGTARKSSTASGSPSPFNTLEANKYKYLMRFSLDNIDISKVSDVNVKKTLKDIETLQSDLLTLNQINDLINNLAINHQPLDDAIKDMISSVSKQLNDKQTNDSQLLSLELAITSQEGVDSLTIIFPSTEKRSSWEATFNEVKQRLVLSTDRKPPPEFLLSLPIRKTRAGLQFTCASPTLGSNQFGYKDVWICNSDGYVGQVCVLSMQPDPNVTSCNGVCNARILCVTAIPGAMSS